MAGSRAHHRDADPSHQHRCGSGGEPRSARVISGSVLSGHRASGMLGWLGAYHNQISVLTEEMLAPLLPMELFSFGTLPREVTFLYDLNEN